MASNLTEVLTVGCLEDSKQYETKKCEKALDHVPGTDWASTAEEGWIKVGSVRGFWVSTV